MAVGLFRGIVNGFVRGRLNWLELVKGSCTMPPLYMCDFFESVYGQSILSIAGAARNLFGCCVCCTRVGAGGCGYHSDGALG